MAKTIPIEHQEAWESFVAMARERLGNGHAEYGGRSFDEHPLELMREIQEELLDTALWAFIGWQRVERLRRALLGIGVVYPRSTDVSG